MGLFDAIAEPFKKATSWASDRLGVSEQVQDLSQGFEWVSDELTKLTQPIEEAVNKAKDETFNWLEGRTGLKAVDIETILTNSTLGPFMLAAEQNGWISETDINGINDAQQLFALVAGTASSLGINSVAETANSSSVATDGSVVIPAGNAAVTATELGSAGATGLAGFSFSDLLGAGAIASGVAGAAGVGQQSAEFKQPPGVTALNQQIGEAYQKAISGLEGVDTTINPYLIQTPGQTLPAGSQSAGILTQRTPTQIDTGSLSSVSASSAQAFTAQASEVDFSEAMGQINAALGNTQNMMAVQDSYLGDWTQLFGSPGVNMNDYFKNYKPEQLEAMGLAQIKQEFLNASDTVKANMARNGLSGSGIESGVLNDMAISQAEALSSQRVSNIQTYYDKLMNWNMFEAQTKMSLMGQKLQALGMQNDLSKTMAQISSNEEQINAAYAQQAELQNAQMRTSVSQYNASNKMQADMFNVNQANQAIFQNAAYQNEADAYNVNVQNQAIFGNQATLNQAQQANKQMDFTKQMTIGGLGTQQYQTQMENLLRSYGLSPNQQESNPLLQLSGTLSGLYASTHSNNS